MVVCPCQRGGNLMSRFRTLFFMSAGASALALALASPAVAQSGAPASGTSEDPPATGVSTGAATPTRADAGARPVHARGPEDMDVTARPPSEAPPTTPAAGTP